MRTGSSDTQLRGHRGGLHVDTRLKKVRKSRHYQIDLEGLEARTLLATTPAAAATLINGLPVAPIPLTSLTSVTGSNPAVDGNANSPTVVVDPYDSQKVFAVWGDDLSSLSPVPHTTAIVEGAFSSNGGTNWQGLGTSVNPVFFPDPLTVNNNPPTAYTEVTDPSVAFDSRGNVYVLSLQSSGASDGALILTEFNFSGNTPSEVTLPNSGIVYQWVTGSDAATSPTLAVDPGTYPNSGPGTTPPLASLPNDPFANNLYIAWASIDTEPANPNPFTAVGFNPDRAELIVGTPISNPSANESPLAFSGVTTLNLNGNFGSQRNTHPQLVINPGNTTNSNQNSIDPGQITIGWEDSGTDATLAPPVTLLLSNIVLPGDSFGFNGGTGLIQPGTSSASPGNWAKAIIYAAGNSPTNAADPVGIATRTLANNDSTDVNAIQMADDIVIADQGLGAIGVLLNSGTGTFPTTSVTTASASPSGVVLGDFVGGHTTATILDAATSNGASSGGVSVLSNGTPPPPFGNDGLGTFKKGVPLPSVPGGQGETGIVSADLDGNGNPDIIAADPGNGSIDIWLNPSAGSTPPISLALPAGDTPIAVAVDKFRGNQSNFDIAVLNANGKILVFVNNILPGTSVTPANFSLQTIATVPNAVSMTSGAVSGNSNTPDLVVVTNSPNFNANELVVIPNTSTPGGAAVTFAAARTVANSNFPGTPVGGNQGVATGDLSNSFHAGFNDIAVVYGLGGSTGESMVAVFQNLDDLVLHSFSRTQPTAGTDFDAGQTDPTAMALLFLTNNLVTPTPKTPWEDIVVTNNDNDDSRDPSPFAGTVSVLQPATSPTVTTQSITTFTDAVNVPNPGALDNFTVTVALTDQQSVGNLSLILMAPNGSTITLLDNANAVGGTAIKPPQGYTNGNAIGVFGFSPTSSPGIAVGTIFDDNATRNIFDPTTAGPPTNGNSATASIGYFQAEGGSLQRFLASLNGSTNPSNINGPWKLVITNFSSAAPAFGNLEQFSLQFSTRMTPPVNPATGQPRTPSNIASQFLFTYPTNTTPFPTIVVGGSLTDTYPTAAPSTPNGVGPG